MRKRVLSFLLTVAMLFNVTSAFAATGLDITPNFIPRPIEVEIESEEVWGLDEVEVTVTFLETAARKVPFTVTVTNGAKILVDDISDVLFVTGGNRIAVDLAETNADQNELTLITGRCVAFGYSSFTFTVKAPLMSMSFAVEAIADNLEPYKGYVTTQVLSGLTIEAPPIVNDVDPFTIFGTATWRRDLPPAGAYVFIEIIDPNDPEVYFVESQKMAFVSDSDYTTGLMNLFTNNPDGNYLIRAYLIHPQTYEFLAYAEREIQYIKRPDVLRVSLERPGFYL